LHKGLGNLSRPITAGIDKKELEIFVDGMLKENKIKKENELYVLA